MGCSIRWVRFCLAKAMVLWHYTNRVLLVLLSMLYVIYPASIDYIIKAMLFLGACSRGIRQRLYNLSKENDWKTKYNIHIGARPDVPGEYTELLRRSKFCLVLPGDGYSARPADAILHGCLPVVIQDNVDPSFATVVDWSKFAVRVFEKDIPNIVEIIQSFTPECIRDMQQALALVRTALIPEAFGTPCMIMLTSSNHDETTNTTHTVILSSCTQAGEHIPEICMAQVITFLELLALFTEMSNPSLMNCSVIYHRFGTDMCTSGTHTYDPWYVRSRPAL